MIDSRRVLEGLPLFSLAAACMAVGVLAVTLFKPEAVLDRSVENALARTQSPGKAIAQAPARLADSPNFHLSSSNGVSPGPSKQVALGDRINISGSSGLAQTLEVIDIRDVDAGLTRVDKTAGPRLLLVTCRDVKGTGSLVRFIIEADETQSPAGQAHRTL